MDQIEKKLMEIKGNKGRKKRQRRKGKKEDSKGTATIVENIVIA